MKKLRVLFLTSITILFTISCEIGLGAYVDTEAPSLEISNPPADAVIRDDFAITGTWTDDGTISKVTVDMVRLQDNSKTSFDGTFTSESIKGNKGTWTVAIDALDSKLLDGTYEALVAIKDNGGHTTTMARSFTIDNTPPVMILQKPSTSIADSADRFDTFGQIFSIVGQAADDNQVEKIDVSVYSSQDCSDSSYIKTVTLSNVPPTIDLNVAVFEENTENDYAAIYGQSTKGAGNVRRYFKLEAYDNAKKYLADGTVEEKGNKQTSYYLYKDISELITEYKATGIYKIQSGTYKGTSSVEAVKTTLNENQINIGKFQLNPDNSPTFVVSARSPLASGETLEEAAYQLTSGNNFLEVQIDPGLDNNPIVEDSVGIYLVECNKNGKLEENGVVLENQNPEGLPDNKKIWLIKPGEALATEVTVSGDSYKFKTTNVISSLYYGNQINPSAADALQIEHFYLICVEGHDKSNSAIVPSSNSVYAFQLASSGSFIELVADADPFYVTSNESSNGVDSTEKNELTVTLRYQGGSTSYNIYEDESDAPLEASSSVVIGDKQTVITKDRNALSTYKASNKQSLKYQIKGAADAASKIKEVSFVIDDEKPVIKDGKLKIGSDAYDAAKFMSSLYLKVSGEFEEENIDTVYYYVQYPGRGEGQTDYAIPQNLTKTHDGEVSKFDGNTFVFPAIEFKDNSESAANKLYLQAIDKSGNLSERKEYTINIDTSAPQIAAYWSKIGSGAVNKASETIYVKENADLFIYGKYSDPQSGVNKIELPEGFPANALVKYSTKALNGTASSELNTFTEEDWKSYEDIENKMLIKSWRLEYTPEASGSVELKGTSLAGKSVTVNAFTIVLDKKKPELNSINLFNVTGSGENKKEAKAYYDSKKDKYYVNHKVPAGKTFALKGNATDNYGLEKIVLQITTESETSSYTATENCNSAVSEFEFTNINLSSWTENPTAKIIVTDKAGNEFSKSLEIIFDTKAPKGLHEIDASNKNLYFRVGQNDNDDISPDNGEGNNGVVWDDSLDKNVGGKYGIGTFGNATTIQLRGNFTDEDSGSGVSMIYYKVYPTEKLYTNEADLESLKNDVINNHGGQFAPLSEIEKRRVFYNVGKKKDENGDFVNPAEPDETQIFAGSTQFTSTPNEKGYYKYYKEVESTFDEAISGFSEGNNFLVIVAVDNVGNSAVDAAEVNYNGTVSKFINYSLNVDKTPPSDITTISANGVMYTNGTNVPLLWGTVSDKCSILDNNGDMVAAGLKSFVLTRDGVDTTVKAKLREIRTQADEAGNPADSDELITLAATDSTLRIWEADITSLIPSESCTVSITATATDAAGTGNSTPGVVATITIDKQAPTVKISANSPSDADTSIDGIQVNSIISLSGTGDDENGVEELVGLYYKIYEGNTLPSAPAANTVIAAEGTDGWKPVSATKSDTVINWTFTDIDTSKLDGTNPIADNTQVCFVVAIKDKAGNIGYSAPKAVIVNQETDRPVITLSQIKNNSTVYTLKTKNVYGSIKDDDGAVEKFWYWSKKTKEAEPTAAPEHNNDNGWTQIEINGNSWSIDSEESDGETTWYFAIEDASGNIFWTKSDSSLRRPFIQFKETAKLDNTDGVTFKYDTNPPTPTYLYLTRYPTVTSGSAKTAGEIQTEDENGNIEWSRESKIAFGGNYNILYAKVLVTESTDMKALTGSADSEPESSPILISYKNKAGESLKVNQIVCNNDGNGNYVYYLGPLVMDTTELHEFKVTVEDAVGNKGYISRTIIVDNEAPSSIKNVKPAKGAPQVGTVNYRGGIDDNKDGSGILFVQDAEGNVTNYGVKYYIPTYAEYEAYLNHPENITLNKWQMPTTPGDSSWEIEFANLGSDIGYNELTYDVSDAYKNYETENGSGLYDIPVWFRLEDNVGNVGYVTSNAITYNPNADRPTVEFTYPKHDKPEGSANPTYVVVGGTITITGMANDDDGIGAVYLQFDTNGDGSFDNSIVAGAYKAEEVVDIPGLVTNGVQEKGILATGTKSWYYTMSVTGMSNLNYETNGGKTLNVRAVSIENDSEKEDAGKPMLHSAWTKNILHLSINNDVPNFSGIKLKKYGNETVISAENLNSVTAIGEQNYTSEMYIKGDVSDGKWYLTGDVVVSSGSIKKIKVTGSSVLNFEVGASDNTLIACRSAGITDDKKYSFAIPVSLNTYEWKIQLYVEDATTGTPATNRYPVTINIDSDAPDFTDKNEDGSLIKLYKNAYGTSGIELSTATAANYVQNSNGGNFTLAGRVTEGGSGFDKLAFYFKRVDSEGGHPRVYNPKEEYGSNNANRTDLESEKTADKVYINDEGLPALYLSLGEYGRENTLSIKSEKIKNNKNIRVGGLVKIGGIYRLIDNVDARDTSGTITFTPSCDTSYKEVELIYAMVVDNNGESEKNGQLKNDDGDGMLESFTKSGSNYTWDATVDSKNIPDGPIEIHCVVFDKAGNSNHGYTKSKVSNNPPRIVNVKLGTDLNSDGYFALDSEFAIHYATAQDGEEIWNLDTKDKNGKYWTAKKGLAVIPEFVGGSGKIYYRYDKNVGATAEGLTAAANGTISGTATLKEILASSDAIKRGGAKADLLPEVDGNNIGAIVLTNAQNDGLETLGWTLGEKNASNAGVNMYSFSFWDSTEECVVGTDTQWCLLNVRFVQDIIDDTAPTGFIKPFYWKSRSENSLAENNPANGHIELESDLALAKDSQGNNIFSTSGSGVYDLDPKVSGKIKIEGEAFDETLLKSIKLSFDGKEVTATYDSSAKTWNNSDNPPDGFELSIDDENGPTQDGHSVKWTYTVDTSKITGVANKNVKIKVEIRDANTVAPNTNGNAYIPDETNSTSSDNPTGYYRVDVVPYITGVTTAFSAKLKSSIKDAYSRTALGHYIARSDEAIKIKGFNLDSASGEVNYDVSQLSESGPLSLTVNGIETLNNLNNNNACGSYTSGITEDSLYSDKFTYAYNRMPNRTSNNLLTDDVWIDLWQFDSDAALPKSGELREPSMKINPVTGEIGLAFVDGPAHFAMAGTVDDTSYSYAEWQRNYATYSNVNFTYDSLGYAHATATGLDTNPNTHHAGRFTYFYNKWGTSGLDTQDGNYNGANAIRLEAIAVPYMTVTPAAEVFNGTTYATIRHKVLANGTFIETADGALTENRFYSPSLVATVHGTGDTASTAVYLAYYDSVQKQIRFRYSSEVPKDKKGNKNDFVDNSGYKQNGDTGSYMEAYTSNFSLIAGVDTQQGEDHFTPVEGSQKVNLQKTDSDGVPLFKMTDYRNAKLNTDGSLTDTKNKGYTIAEFTMDATIFGSLQDALKARFTVGQKYNWIQNGNFRWIIQDDGLIYYTTEENPAKGYMTMVPCSTYQAHEKSVKVKDNPLRKLDPDENYIVYEKVGIADSSINEGNDKNKVGTVIEDYKYKFYQQPDYYWPYSSGTPATYLSEELPNAVVYSSHDTGYTAYKYVAIDAMAGSDAAHDKVVAVWYDGTNCRYAYNDAPTSGKDNGSEVTVNGATYGGGWKGNKVIFSEGGEHCTVKLDSEGGVHIAAYVDGSLRYAYLSSVDAGYSEATDSVKVDSFTITGERITLDTGKDAAGRIIPYISYFNGTARLPAVAKLVVPSNGTVSYTAQGTGTLDGDDLFTGNWEVSLIPSPKTLTTNYYDKVNICLWKQNGIIVRSDNTAFTISKDKTSANNSSSNTNGNIYGNGTANPILGYAVESNSGTCLETAQMK